MKLTELAEATAAWGNIGPRIQLGKMSSYHAI